jgi:hypothetical protein
MPALQAELHREVAEAIRLAEIAEIARSEAARGSQTRRNLHPSRIELIYELAYLRTFLAWEVFLEQAFLRYLCGYSSSQGVAVPQAGVAFSATLAHAELTVLAGRPYRLWHNPTEVADRSSRLLASCPIETVLRSSIARLDAFAAIRHRIAHAQADARRKFDAATMAIAGRRYKGARPGAFLRDRDVSVIPAVRWIEQLGRELQGLAAQIA